MPGSFRLLILEDSALDADLMVETLHNFGLDPTWTRVDKESDYLSALDSCPDLILSDFSMPQFDARRALHLLKDHGLDIPFIVVSGCIGEDVAVQCMKDGASDYLLKDRLARLGPSVTQALERIRLQKEKKAIEERLFHETFHDALTGLPNRALFLERLDRSLLRSKRDRTYVFAVLLLKLEGLSTINETLGPSASDQLTIEASQRLSRHVRSLDSVARLAGEEFLILLDDLKTATNAGRVATRIQQAVALPLIFESREIILTAGLGITASLTGYDNPENMLRDAGVALNRASSLGKGSFVMFDATMHAQAMERLKLEADLRQALERDEFKLHYQPIVSLETGHIAGFEALLRWQHAERGLISPIDYIHVVEETGLILPIGRWIIHEACRQLRSWQAKYQAAASVTMSVNLSSKQFNDPELLLFIEKTLKDTGLAGETLKIEITESVMMDNVESAAILLRDLKSLHHVQTCIDDFGTGYSSLSYLQRFPIDYLKIDQSFVARMGDDPKSLEIIHTIISLAQTLGAKVIAEGAETSEQVALLKAWKCQYAQGYFFSKPLTPDEAGKLLTAG
ncbi:MAG: GGDEF domain-containing response regulator [Nitrospira sp.]|nr:MAG: GGDEF domain-containing response regulator [Nitrospira sp.]